MEENHIRKTSKEERETASWPDLPQDILGIILAKLQPRAVDLIRFRSVCKNWRIPRDRSRINPHRLPMVCNLSVAVDNSDHLECEIFDPYWGQVLRTTEKKQRYADYKKLKAYGSKQGWLIVGALDDSGHSMFMYNEQEIIPLPFLKHHFPHFATISGNPAVSQDCQVSVICVRGGSFYRNYYIASYYLNSEKQEWRFGFLETSRHECYGMQYVSGQLYCLFGSVNRSFGSAILRRYSLADGCWTSIGESLEIDHGGWRGLWLMKGEGGVLVACKVDYQDVWSTFCFDWCRMSWVETYSLGSAIFVSGKTAMIRPLGGEDCRVFYFKDGVYCHCTCYSFLEKRIIETPEYAWISKRYFDIMAFVED